MATTHSFRRTTFLAFLPFALVAASACNDLQPTATTQAASTPTPLPTATATPVPPTATPTPTPSPSPAPEPIAMLQDSAARMQKVQSLSMVMHMDLNLTSSGLSLLIPMDVTGDVAAPDKSHIQSKLSILGQNFSVERIQVGDKAYVRQSPTDPWALEGQSTVSLPFNPQSFMLFGPGAADFVTPADLKQTFQSVTLVGEESVDGVATQHFTGILPAMNLGPDFATATTNLSVDIWVGKEDRLIRKMTMNGILPMTQPIPGSPATLPQSGTLNVSMNATFSRYNQPVAIELPVVAVQPTTTPVVR